ncbi:glycine zipper domain-containing protein [Salinicola halophyticus]|uniref:glycine zipper domain-containing protein n=1 Tax=Salinicola halophyticus TaxID=1808881 RepID=UPI003F4633DC
MGSLAGAVFGALAGGAAGGMAGARIGNELDEQVLDNRECHACGHTFRVEAVPPKSSL